MILMKGIEFFNYEGAFLNWALWLLMQPTNGVATTFKTGA
jgi:hypothetical protein